EQQREPEGAERGAGGAAGGGEELHRHGAGDGHQRADGEVDAGGRDHQAHAHGDHRDRGGGAQDVDEVADEAAGGLVVADGEVAGVLEGVDQQQQGDRDEAPEVGAADQLPHRRVPRGAVGGHEPTPVPAGWGSPGPSGAVSSAMVAMSESVVTDSSTGRSASLWRSLSTMIRSLRRTTSSSSEEMNTIATPSSARAITCSMISVLAP